MNLSSSVFALSLLTCSVSFAGSNTTHPRPDSMKPFPAAESGMVRKVIHLPAVANPELYRVQLLPGKVMAVDCNRTSLNGTMTEKTAEGWGFNYWVVDQVEPGPSTMMACPPNAKKKYRFVSVYSEQLHRYNAKIPLVVYVPEGIELRYRVFSAKGKVKTAVSR